MTYVIAIIEDDTFADPHVILGASDRQVAALVRRYLYITRPATTEGRLSVDPREDYSLIALWELLEDCDDVRLAWYSTEDGSATSAGAFEVWLTTSADALSRQHDPHVVDVVQDL